MSKLDDIFLKYAPADDYDSGMVDPEWERQMNEQKQQIKDLIVEIAGPEATSNPFTDREFNAGYNHCLAAIKQRVDKL